QWRYTSSFAKCAYWHGGAAGNYQSARTYPAPDQRGDWSCSFEKSQGDMGKYPTCAKLSDGRVAYGRYDHRSIDTGKVEHMFCAYPAAKWLKATVKTTYAATGATGRWYSVAGASAAQ